MFGAGRAFGFGREVAVPARAANTRQPLGLPGGLRGNATALAKPSQLTQLSPKGRCVAEAAAVIAGDRGFFSAPIEGAADFRSADTIAAMIDIRLLRDDPQRFREGARKKRIDVDIDRLLALDERRRALMTEQESLRAEQRRIEKEIGPKIGALVGRIKKSDAAERAALESELASLRDKPAALKRQIRELDEALAQIQPECDALLLATPLPPAPDVPEGDTSEDNVELRRWNPEGFDTARSFEDNRGFRPKSHVELGLDLGLFDFERGVKMAGARSYVLTGDGMRLHQAILRYAFDFMTETQGFTPVSAPVLVREEIMVGTGFFPAGRDQAYRVDESTRGSAHDLFLTGTGEVGLMGLRAGEILEWDELPLRMTTLSTCFRREAGAAGKDTAGLFRIHQFDKVEQVVICAPDHDEQRAWHGRMIGFVEEILRSLDLPHRLVQCCTGDLGPKNSDMIDIECWMPSRGGSDDARPPGAYAETHSASRLDDFQTRRLSIRAREPKTGAAVFPFSLNNTVAASPRILIPLIEMHQTQDGGVAIPKPLRPFMGGRERIG